MLNELNRANAPLVIRPVDSPAMSRYGRVIRGIDCGEMFPLSLDSADPLGPTYIRDLPGLRQFDSFSRIERKVYGGKTPLQAGLCFGMNDRMNGMEYHEGSEVIIAVTPMVLILGRSEDIVDLNWNSSRGECFFLSEGTVLELYSNTLHLAPCRVTGEPFCAIIILPEGTNSPLESRDGEDSDPLYFMKNKWLICHEESPALARGSYKGISGTNIRITPL